MHLERLANAVLEIEERAAEFRDAAVTPSTGDNVDRVIRLWSALEELAVVHEELRVQSEELNRSFEASEIERQRYQLLFDLAPSACVVTDAWGRLKEINVAATELLGKPPGVAAGQLLASKVPLVERRKLRRALGALQRGSHREDFPLAIVGPHAERVDLHVTATRLPSTAPGGDFLWLLNPEEARRDVVLESALNSAPGIPWSEQPSWFVDLAHELRTPLTVIAGNARLLDERVGPSLDDEARESVEQLVEHCQRLTSLIERALSSAKR
jgi:signal transduction histidine kinase